MDIIENCLGEPKGTTITADIVGMKREPSFSEKMRHFEASVKGFADLRSLKDSVDRYCKSEDFMRIYRRKNAPAYFKYYNQKAMEVGPNVKISISIESLGRYRSREKPRGLSDSQKYSHFMRLRCYVNDSICVGKNQNKSVSQLMLEAKAGDRDAFVKLVELDSGFLTAPFAREILRLAEVSQDKRFKLKLAEALNPAQASRAFESQRQRHALQVISSLGYWGKPLSLWARFFRSYNDRHRQSPSELKKYGFETYERVETLKKAVKTHKIRFDPPGKRHSQST